jgi:hypothetical protein
LDKKSKNFAVNVVLVNGMIDSQRRNLTLTGGNKQDGVMIMWRKYEAQQRIEQANGEAQAIKIQAQAITQQGGADYVKLQWIKQWDGKLPTTMLSSGTPFININP